MYRLLLFALLGLAACHRGYRYGYRSHPWHFRRHDNRFNRLATHVIGADRYLRGFCKENANSVVHDIYEDGGYKLIYNIPQCNTDYISVRIKHRVLYMSAQATSRSKVFVDMRILPDLLDFDSATWTYQAPNLEILIPYQHNFRTELEKTCGEVSTRLVVVPQFGYDMRNRFGEEDEEETVDTTDPTDIFNTPDTATDAYDVYLLANTTGDPLADNNTIGQGTSTSSDQNGSLIFPD